MTWRFGPPLRVNRRPKFARRNTIGFRQWTPDGKLRQSSYKGLRERQDNADVYRLGDEQSLPSFNA
ncbi:hypothetical protein ELH12_23670 [Rhizobium ruizarguesonis]|nr:hypothetical protein ELH12_23670 [Rhizobium ruizarguesonis]